jgi:pre-mRNA-splicing factor SYF2
MSISVSYLSFLVLSCCRRIEKKKKFSRRRAFHEDQDIDYINDRNMRFNKKAERFFGKYTQKIKDDLERGTAL